MTLVYANIAIFWQLLRFNSLKKHFPQIYRFKRFENGLEKSSLIWNFFPWFWLKNSCFSLISLTGKSLQNFPWIPWSVGTLLIRVLSYFSGLTKFQDFSSFLKTKFPGIFLFLKWFPSCFEYKSANLWNVIWEKNRPVQLNSILTRKYFLQWDQGGHIPAKIKFPDFSLSFPCATSFFPVLFLCHK